MSNLFEFLESKSHVIVSLIVISLITLLLFYFPVEQDISRNKSNSISKQSKEFLKNYQEKDIEVIYFSAVTNTSVDTKVLDRISTIFTQFRKYNKHIKYHIIDVSQNPESLNTYKIATTKGILIKQNTKEILMPFESFVTQIDNELSISIEKNLINEFIRLGNKAKYDLYYTTNHNEELQSENYSDFKYLLRSMGYVLKPVDLSTQDITNIENLIIMAPSKDFSLDEINKLNQIFNNGGNILFSIKYFDTNTNNNLENLRNFCKEFGLNVSNDIIVDQIQDTKLIGVYTDLEANKALEKLNPIVYLPNSRKVTLDYPDICKAEIVMTSGELSANKNDTNGTYPLIIKLFNDNSKILFTATSEMYNNNNIQNNIYFIEQYIDWIHNTKLMKKIDDFIYIEYITNPNELKPSLIFGVIQILIPCVILYIGIDIRRQRKFK